jgi:hypothetical protein
MVKWIVTGAVLIAACGDVGGVIPQCGSGWVYVEEGPRWHACERNVYGPTGRFVRTEIDSATLVTQ